jgi:hypothetical protein
MQVSCRALYGISDADDLRNAMKTVLARFDGLRTTSTKPELVAVKALSTVPSFAMVVFDPGQETNEMIVEMYPYRVTPARRPHFVLRRGPGRWFEHFNDQFESLWTSARAVELPAHAHHG